PPRAPTTRGVRRCKRGSGARPTRAPCGRTVAGCETPPSNIDRRKEGFHMSETSFTDDLKHMVRHTADRVQNGLQPALGNLRALTKLLAMTHAKKCEARSEAADALGTLRGKKAKLALKKLAHAKFKDEARSPGIFSCSSRRAAQKALERQARG